MRRFYLIFVFILCCSLPLHSRPTYSTLEVTPFIHEYTGYYTYDGDASGNFRGDSVVILDDGSAWKIDPNHKDKLIDWNIGDKVHIEVRTSWSLYKREHKFILFNHQKNEGIFVMLIDTPFIVDFSEEPTPTVRTEHWPLPDVYSDYKQNLVLSNGTYWEIDSYSSDKRFSKNMPVYVGYNTASEDFLDSKYTWSSFFLIGGKGKDANWEWAREGNYSYFFD